MLIQEAFVLRHDAIGNEKQPKMGAGILCPVIKK
jgi:hypothetical protein